MNVTLSRLAREVALLRTQLAPPAEPMPILEMAERLGLALDPWQRDALQSDARQLLLNVSHQGGKSTVAALLGLHELLTVPNGRVLLVSPGERQSKLLFATLLRFYRALGRPVPAITENKLSLELVTGADAYALPSDEDRIRGFASVTLLLADEASRIFGFDDGRGPPDVGDHGGAHRHDEHPNGPLGWWYDAWINGGDDWQRFEIPATAIPRISPTFLARERRALPKLIYRAEYECAFVARADAVFDAADIAAALVADLPGVRLFSSEELIDVA